MASPVTGAWQLLDESSNGRLLITDKHFCAVFARQDRSAPKSEQPTEVEAAALFRSMSGPFAGISSLSEEGGEWKLSLHLVVSARPAGVGGSQVRACRVEGDTMEGEVIGSDGTRERTARYHRLSEPGTSPLAGAWEVVSDTWDGMLAMTDTQYRYLVTRKDRPDIKTRLSELTDADAALLFHAFDAQGGSYGLEGSTMVRTPDVARDPREQGHNMAVEFSIDGETLTTHTAQGQLQWRKLGQERD